MYIGSSENIKKRFSTHKSQLRNSKHHNKYLQNSWNKYGEEVFIFSTIEIIDNLGLLIEREQYWINFYDVCNKKFGYNIAPIAGSTSGYIHTETDKEKMRNGLKVSEKNKERLLRTKAKIIRNKFGQTRSEANKGSKNSSAKLTETDVLNIVSMLLKGYKHTEIIKNYNVDADIISHIKCGRRWGHLLDEETKEQLMKLKCKKLNESIVKEIKILLIQGIDIFIIAEKYDVSKGSIYDIKNNKKWKNIVIDKKI